jgi:outer membrane lipoprotein-sorting protein
MQRRTPVFLGILAGMCLSHAVAAAETKAPSSSLSAAQVVDKHIAARGGLSGWHGVQTLSVTGKMDAGTADSAARSAVIARGGTGASVRRAGSTMAPTDQSEKQQVQLPFRLEMKKPRKSRLEIDFAGKTAVQVYDGQNGWKLRPYLNRNDVEPFSKQEAKSQSDKGDLEGPLVDYAAKGTKIAVEGMEPVEGHSAYKLKLTMKNGDVSHVWIDAQSFLDVKVEGIPRRMDGKMRKVWISQRDFRPVQGLMVPFLYETAVEGSPQTHKMVVDTVAVNRPLEDARFTKPQAQVADSPATPPAAAPKQASR